jgi:LacI family transcriptional regulator
VDVINHLLSRRVSGLIVHPLEGDASLTQTLQDLLKDDVPLVFLDRRSTLPADQVYSECVGSTFELTAHLASLGHRRIAFVRGALSAMSAQDRLAGYQRAVTELGLDADPHLIIAGESDERIAEDELAKHLSTSAQRATALVVANNQMTLGAMRAIKRCGLKVPRDIAVVCYDDFEWADLFDPQISAMAQDAASLAARTVDLLLARIESPTRPAQTAIVPTSFQHRDSCGCGRKKYRGTLKPAHADH